MLKTPKALRTKIDDSGQGMAEYIVVLLLVGIVVLGAVRLFGRSVSCEFNSASDSIDSGVGSTGDCSPGRSSEESPDEEPEAPPLPPLPSLAPAAPPPPPPSPPLPPAPPPPAPPPPEPVPTAIGPAGLPPPPPPTLPPPPTPEPTPPPPPEPTPLPTLIPTPEPTPIPTPVPTPTRTPFPTRTPAPSPTPTRPLPAVCWGAAIYTQNCSWTGTFCTLRGGASVRPECSPSCPINNDQTIGLNTFCNQFGDEASCNNTRPPCFSRLYPDSFPCARLDCPL